MPVIHDIACDSGHEQANVMLRKKDEAGNWVYPLCTECGGETHFVPTTMQTISSCRREPPADVREHFTGKGGFAQRNAKERLEDHKEARRKGDPGNQPEFSQFVPLTEGEHKDEGSKPVEKMFETKLVPR